MKGPDYDVLIIGGGPAGATAGALLARAGVKAALFERESFPRFAIGESLLPACNSILKRSGAWRKIEQAGFIRKEGAEFLTTDGAQCVHNQFAKGLVKEWDYTYQVDRARFDKLLLDHAADEGCHRFQPMGVDEVALGPAEVSLRTSTGEIFTGRYLLDASGRRAFLAKALNLPRDELRYPPKVAVYSHFCGVRRRGGSEAGNILIVRLPKGWCWSIPIDGETTSVGCVGYAEELKASGLPPREWFVSQVATSPFLSRWMEHAESERDFATTADYTYQYRSFGGARHLLAGDAASFIDPIFSSGVYLALHSAAAAADVLMPAALGGGQCLPRLAHDAYTRDVKRRVKVMRQLIDVFYSDQGFKVFMAPTEKLGLFPAINSIVAGNTDPSFSVRWRFNLFRAVAKLNERFDFVKPKDTGQAPDVESIGAGQDH